MADRSPLGDHHEVHRLCTRLVGRNPDGTERLCGKTAVEHVIHWLDPTLPISADSFDHGYSCAEHWADYQRRWTCAAHHPVNAACSMPGSSLGLTRPCEFEGLPVAEAVRAVAEPLPASRATQEGGR